MRKNNSKRNSVLCVFILREWVEKCLSFGLMILALFYFFNQAYGSGEYFQNGLL